VTVSCGGYAGAMKKRILWLVLLAAAVVTASLAITSPLVQNLLYTGRRTGGSDRVTGTYELHGEDLTLKEPVEPRTVMLTGRIDQQGGEISIDLTNGKTRTVVCKYPGYFQQEVQLPAGSTYLEVVCRQFTGYILLESRKAGHPGG